MVVCVTGNYSSNNFYEQVYRYCHPNFLSKSVIPKMFYKEWQIVLGLHLVSVTLDRQFTIKICASQIELVTLKPVFDLVL